MIQIGDKFGKLEVIEKSLVINGQYCVKCRCDCGNEKITQTSQLYKGKGLQCNECAKPNYETQYNGFIINKTDIQFEGDKFYNIELECKICSTKKLVVRNYFNTKPNIICEVCNNQGFKGNKICITYLKKVKNNAEKKNLDFNLDDDYLWDLFEKQNKLCVLTGIPINIIQHSIRINYQNQTASIDRIDSSKGYIKGNVRWVHKYINQLKSDFTDDELIYLCRLVSENNKEKFIEIEIDKLNKGKKRVSNSIERMRDASSTKRSVLKLDLNDNLILEYNSINEAARQNNLKGPMGIISCCKGRQKSHAGFKWKYK